VYRSDPKLIARIARHIERVLIVDSNIASARLLGDVLKDIGSRQPVYASKTESALDLVADFQPQLVFTDLEGPNLDGVELTHRLRRSGLVSRKSPVVVTAFQPREGAIKAARDAGAHEFLVKPFTSGHLFKRIENVTLKPRLWVESRMYVGPDRRRFYASEFNGQRKRLSDDSETRRLACTFAAAEQAFRAQLDLYELKPHQALKGMLERACELQATAFHSFDPDLTAAVTSLLGYLALSVERGDMVRPVVEQHMTAIRALRDPINKLDAQSRSRLLLNLSNASAANVAA